MSFISYFKKQAFMTDLGRKIFRQIERCATVILKFFFSLQVFSNPGFEASCYRAVRTRKAQGQVPSNTLNN